MDAKQIDVMVADASHEVYVDKILDTIREAAKVRGTGIAERTHEYLTTKIKEGKAIIALNGDDFAGFTYIESWVPSRHLPVVSPPGPTTSFHCTLVTEKLMWVGLAEYFETYSSPSRTRVHS